MIYLHRSTLVIAVLTVLLAVILLLPMPERKETMAQPEEAVRRKELTAPVRHIREPLEDEKICYLTFDDGPSENTEKVLDILSEHGAKATFFVIGESLNEEMRPLLQRMREEGHAVGMHANVHSYDRLYRSLDSFLTDYESLYTKLKDEYDIDTAIFRFPEEAPAAA